MMAWLRLAARLISFAAACWILGLVFWGLLTGAKHFETPLIAVWVFIGGLAAQLCLWLASKVAREA